MGCLETVRSLCRTENAWQPHPLANLHVHGASALEKARLQYVSMHFASLPSETHRRKGPRPPPEAAQEEEECDPRMPVVVVVYKNALHSCRVHCVCYCMQGRAKQSVTDKPDPCPLLFRDTAAVAVSLEQK